MRFTSALSLASLAALASAKDSRTFAVLRFDGDGFLTEGPVDPVVNPGTESTHYHGIMGGSNFGATVEGDQLMDSKCTTAKIKNDKSNYWVPALFFQDPKNGTFQKVPVFYMNVYYFFEATNDVIKPFPIGLKMLSGDSKARTVPQAGGNLNLDPDNGIPIQPVQWTCPRSSYDPPSYPVNSDGSSAGMVDTNNKGSGTGFPLYPCDGYASPLRQDIHFPSCYNPEAGLNDHTTNMKFPSNVGGGKQDCPKGWMHVPHIFFEVYWNTPLFDDYWTPDGKTQPFLLSSGDMTGFSSHGDFISGWDQHTLQRIIDTCDAGDIGMDKCPDIPGGLNDVNNCKIQPEFGSIIDAGVLMHELPVVGTSTSGFGDEHVDPPVVSKSTSKAPAATSVASGSDGGEETPATSVSAVEVPATTAGSEVPADGSYPGYPVKTIWDVVTVTVTTTVVGPSPTAAAQRRAPKHSHGHAARHLAGSFAARR